MTTIDNSMHHNESIPSDVYAFMAGPNLPEVLIVDGYDRWNSKNVAAHLNHAFAADHGKAVAAFGAPFDTCANQEVGGAVDLLDYRTVLWVLGDESTGNETFSASEAAGGKNVSGEWRQAACFRLGDGWVGIWIDSSGPSAEDRSFYNNYLCADYVSDDMDEYETRGRGGVSIFGTSAFSFDEGSRGIYRVTTPDVMAPANGAVKALESLLGKRCCVRAARGDFRVGP